jgi:hypothetical protein
MMPWADRRDGVIVLWLMLLLLWPITHSYQGLSGDAELYAVQAMARIQPNLGNDLFLRDGLQDKFTLFSPLYARTIRLLGLRAAALTLLILFKIGFFWAAFTFGRAVANARIAFLGVALLMIVAGTYGGYGAFRYAEDLLTARSLAEALVAAALALQLHDRNALSGCVAVLALLVHPLMALPGVLVLACLASSQRVALVAAAMGVLGVGLVALWSAYASPRTGLFAVVDPPWLEVVRERSVFLFLPLWRGADWANAARPLLSLGVTALALRDGRIRALCGAAALVAVTGLVIAFIAATVGPVALLLQSQPWRWIWVACFASVLLAAPTAATLCRDRRSGWVTALLLIAGWTLAPLPGTTCVGLALLLGWLRARFDGRVVLPPGVSAVACGSLALAWASFEWWTSGAGTSWGGGGFVGAVTGIRSLLGVPIVTVTLALSLILWLNRARSPAALAATSLALLLSASLFLPRALAGDVLRAGAPAEVADFAAWREVIPPASNVYVAPAHYSAAFCWFTLQRPDYLSVNQSAGVVFSRDAALEVVRRSEVLLPMMAPDWRLYSAMLAARGEAGSAARSQPLTRERLMSLCRDPALGFVVAWENVGFEPLPHRRPGDWKNWNLYDCSRVRAPGSGA